MEQKLSFLPVEGRHLNVEYNTEVIRLQGSIETITQMFQTFAQHAKTGIDRKLIIDVLSDTICNYSLSKTRLLEENQAYIRQYAEKVSDIYLPLDSELEFQEIHDVFSGDIEDLRIDFESKINSQVTLGFFNDILLLVEENFRESTIMLRGLSVDDPKITQTSVIYPETAL